MPGPVKSLRPSRVLGVLTWWQVRSRAVHTNTPETPRANALVRKSWGGPCEPLSTRSICGPAATAGIAGGGLGGSQVADTRGAPAVFRNPDALLICRSQQRSEGGPGAGSWECEEQEVGKAMWVSPRGRLCPLQFLLAWPLSLAPHPPSTEGSLGAHRGHLFPLWGSALTFSPPPLTLGSCGLTLEGQGPGCFPAWGSDPRWMPWEAPSGSFVPWALFLGV